MARLAQKAGGGRVMAKKDIRKKVNPDLPHCTRENCGIEPEEAVCRHCGWWSTEAERRRELPLVTDPETGLRRKYVRRGE